MHTAVSHVAHGKWLAGRQRAISGVSLVHAMGNTHSIFHIVCAMGCKGATTKRMPCGALGGLPICTACTNCNKAVCTRAVRSCAGL